MTLDQYIDHKLQQTNVDPRFLEDCLRICDVVKSTMGLDLSPLEANRIWQCYSDSQDAQWLSVNENGDIIAAVHQYVNQRISAIRSRLMVGEYA